MPVGKQLKVMNYNLRTKHLQTFNVEVIEAAGVVMLDHQLDDLDAKNLILGRRHHPAAVGVRWIPGRIVWRADVRICGDVEKTTTF